MSQPGPVHILDKIEVLRTLSFGYPVAEDEKDELKKYFLQTVLWNNVLRGEVDLILGQKGSGKSAIFFLLQETKPHLLGKRNQATQFTTHTINAENPRGDAAFKNLATDPPASEREIELIWRLYFLSLIARRLQDDGTSDKPAKD